MKLTDEIRAQVYLELADDIDDHSLLSAENLRNRAKEKDPPRPEPGTFVWWRWEADLGPWLRGIIHDNGKYVVHGGGMVNLAPIEDCEIKPARILGPDEVAVKIPPVNEWPEEAHRIVLWPEYYTKIGVEVGCPPEITITRTEAERIEAEQ